MDRKQKVYEYISSAEYIPLNISEMAAVLDVPHEDKDELLRLLDELCREGKIFLTKKNKYMAVELNHEVAAGRISCVSKGFFAFLIPDDEDGEEIFIHGDKLSTAIHGDRALVSIEQNSSGARREGRVIRVLERANSSVVGVITNEKNGYLVLTPDSRKIYKNIYINPEKSGGAKIGDRAAVEIIKYSENGRLYGEVLVILGESDSLKGCIEGILLEHKIKQDFDDDTLRQAAKTADTVSDEDSKERIDLRDKLIFTIDGDDARDFDDAVSLDILDNGNYELGVHIADVTHYVKEGSALDNEAFERGTSVYLPDRVIPMLPERLSNGICSLNPNVDRLTLSATMEINSKGEVLSHRLEETVINSKYRMTYKKVTAILEGDEALREEYKEIVPTLEKMAQLAQILRDKRDRRGAIQFDFPETGVVLNELGAPIDIVRLDRGISNKMIEEFMLAANETVAEYAFWSELPFVYRVHESPSAEKINTFNNFIKPFGLVIKGRFDEENPLHPKELQKILDEVTGSAEERMVAMTMLRSLMKAEYKTQNLGHFGLAAKFYCHFTSPIRRYPDLAIHRILKSFISGKMDADMRDRFISFCSAAAQHSSDTELEAEYAERDCDDLMKAAYMSAHIGMSFTGFITHITGFGIFVELENSIEGLVRLENMAADYYRYSEEDFALLDSKGNIAYRIGDEVCVTVVRADMVSRQIDFVLADNVSNKILEKFRTDNRKQSREKELIEKRSKAGKFASRQKRKFLKKRGKKRNG